MAIKSLNPYINFDGTAARAIALYDRILGAHTVNVARAGDTPGMNVPADQKDRIMHAVLMLDGLPLMLSDAATNVSTGSNVHVSLDFTDLDEMTQKFAALAEGGAVNVPLQDTFWGAKFGMLTDSVGVRWIFNCATQEVSR
jgi:PhnB protein